MSSVECHCITEGLCEGCTEKIEERKKEWEAIHDGTELERKA